MKRHYHEDGLNLKTTIHLPPSQWNIQMRHLISLDIRGLLGQLGPLLPDSNEEILLVYGSKLR